MKNLWNFTNQNLAGLNSSCFRCQKTSKFSKKFDKISPIQTLHPHPGSPQHAGNEVRYPNTGRSRPDFHKKESQSPRTIEIMKEKCI